MKIHFCSAIRASVWAFLLHFSAFAVAAEIQATEGAAAEPVAVENEGARPAAAFDLGSLKAKLAQVQAATGFDEQLKAQLTELYTDAVKHAESAAGFGRKSTALKDAWARSADEIKRLRAELKAAREKPKDQYSPSAYRRISLADLKTKLAQAQTERAATASQLTALEKASEQARARPTQARERLTELMGKTEQLEEKSAVSVAQKPQMQAAKMAVREATRLAIGAETDMLNQELLGHEATISVLKARRDLAALKLARLAELVKPLEETVNERQRLEAETARMEAELAERAASGKHPIVKKLAERNAEYGRELAASAARYEGMVQERDQILKIAKRIEEDSRTARQRLEVGGLSPTLGRILLEQRRALLTLNFKNKGSTDRRKSIAELGLKQLKTEEQRRRLADISAVSDGLLAEYDGDALPPKTKKAVETELAEMLGDQRGILDKLAAANAAEIKVLGDVDFQQSQLARRIAAFRSFIEERLIWIPSAPVLGREILVSAPVAVAWLWSPGNWLAVLDTLLREAQLRAPLAAVSVVLAALLFGYRRRLRRFLARTAELVQRPSTDGFRHTAMAIAASTVLAMAWPTVLMAVGNLLFSASGSSEFASAVGRGLLVAGVFLLFVQLFRHLLDRNGVAEVHFRWNRQSISRLRANLLWAGPILTVVIAVVALVQWQEAAEYRFSLSPIAAFVGLGCILVFTIRVLSPADGVLAHWFPANPDKLSTRMRYVWYGALLLAPIALLGLVTLGYVYTAMLFSIVLFQTALLTTAVILANETFLRWLYVSQRRLALNIALEKSKQKETTAEGGAVTVESTDVDLVTVNEHASRLVRVVLGFIVLIGLSLIWSETVPVLGVLNGVGLWSHATTVDGRPRFRSLPWRTCCSRCWSPLWHSPRSATFPGYWRSRCCSGCPWRRARVTPPPR